MKGMDTHEEINDTPLEIEKNGENKSKTTEIVQELKQNPTELVSNNSPKFIKKKWKFIKFKRLVARGGYTSAKLIAQSLGVSRETIFSWMNTKAIQDAAASDINDYVKNIKKAKDWKSKAYLLDKVLESGDKQGQKSDLNQLIVINT